MLLFQSVSFLHCCTLDVQPARFVGPYSTFLSLFLYRSRQFLLRSFVLSVPVYLCLQTDNVADRKSEIGTD